MKNATKPSTVRHRGRTILAATRADDFSGPSIGLACDALDDNLERQTGEPGDPAGATEGKTPKAGRVDCARDSGVLGLTAGSALGTTREVTPIVGVALRVGSVESATRVIANLPLPVPAWALDLWRQLTALEKRNAAIAKGASSLEARIAAIEERHMASHGDMPH